MRRRDVIGFIGGAAALPFGARAQQGDRPRRIAVLMAYAEGDLEGEQRVLALRQSLREWGWADGQSAIIELRWHGGDPERAKAHAQELVQLAPDVIVVNGTPALTAARQATRSVPIVFVVVTDPVGAGHFSSLSQPGGNITGFSTFEPDMGAKWLEVSKEIAPDVTRVGVLMNPDLRGFSAVWRRIETLAPSFGLRAVAVHAADGPTISQAIEDFAQQPEGGLIVFPTPVNSVHRQTVFSLAAEHRLPAVYPFAFHLRSGGLVAYGFNSVDLFRRAGGYVHRVLNGEKPGDLPVQSPTKFELVVNLKTAKALGLTLPESLLLQADEVIE